MACNGANGSERSGMTPQFVSSARRRFAASAAPLAKGGNAVIGANCKSDANVCSVPGHQVGGTARPRDHAAPRERSCRRGRVVPSSTKQSTGAARAVSREPVDGDPSSESSHQRKSEAPPLHEPKGDAQLARVIGLAAYGAWIANFLSLPRPALNVSHETSDGGRCGIRGGSLSSPSTSCFRLRAGMFHVKRLAARHRRVGNRGPTPAERCKVSVGVPNAKPALSPGRSVR